MKYTRQEHINFLEEELESQTNIFNRKLNTSALYLLKESQELFVAQFLTFRDGEMIMKFSTERSLPRKGEYLYCFTVPKVLRNYRNWGDMTYGDLIKEKSNFTEAVCLWQADSKDKDGNIEPNYCLAGFRGIDLEFSVNISQAEKMIFILGPNKPPFKYLINLRQIVENKSDKNISFILDQYFHKGTYKPILLNKNIPAFILNQLILRDNVILIGPPGTGKTYQIAEICKQLCEDGKSVLVTSLTNRALIEVAQKDSLKILLEEGKVFKTKVTVDEQKEVSFLLQAKEMSPQSGCIVLSTFFISSREAVGKIISPFDYVIIDEASQAFLAMFAGATILGKKNIWIGDTKQLSPIVSLNEDKILKKKYGSLINGLEVLSQIGDIPIYQLTETYRLSKRGAEYTGIFYDNSLKSKASQYIRLTYPEMPDDINKFFNPNGGPSLIKMNFKIGDKKPNSALDFVKLLVSYLLQVNEKLHITVLSSYIETIKSLQTNIYKALGNHRNLLIETISKIQGLTTDVVIYLIPNTGYNFSLEKRLFNVATSRARRHVIIICDKNILTSYQYLDEDVKKYFETLDNEYSFFLT